MHNCTIFSTIHTMHSLAKIVVIEINGQVRVSLTLKGLRIINLRIINCVKLLKEIFAEKITRFCKS